MYFKDESMPNSRVLRQNEIFMPMMSEMKT